MNDSTKQNHHEVDSVPLIRNESDSHGKSLTF